MEEGNIVKVAMRQSDGQIKERPAVLLKRLQPYGDWLICGISSKLHQEVEGFDVIIYENDSEFSRSGLKRTSLVRLGYLTWMEEKNINGSFGSLSKQTHKLLCNRLADHLRK